MPNTMGLEERMREQGNLVKAKTGSTRKVKINRIPADSEYAKSILGRPNEDRADAEDDDDEGRWVTTEKDHKVHINENGVPDKGNPHVLAVMNQGRSGRRTSGTREHKSSQLAIIKKHNAMKDDYHTGIREESDIRTFEEALDDDDVLDGGSLFPDVSEDDYRKAMETGKITVYSSHPIEQGSFVTPSRMEAESYAGRKDVYSAEVDVDKVAWIDSGQGQYADVDDAEEAGSSSGTDADSAFKPHLDIDTIEPGDSFEEWQRNNLHGRDNPNRIAITQLYEDEGFEAVQREYLSRKTQDATKDLHLVDDYEADETLSEHLRPNVFHGWFMEANSEYKPRVIDAVTATPEARNAALSIMYENYRQLTDGDLSYEEFLTTPIKMYRGGHGQEHTEDDIFSSYSFSKSTAEKFAGGNGRVYEAEIRPIDTWGSVTTNKESEIMVPSWIAPNGNVDHADGLEDRGPKRPISANKIMTLFRKIMSKSGDKLTGLWYNIDGVEIPKDEVEFRRNEEGKTYAINPKTGDVSGLGPSITNINKTAESGEQNPEKKEPKYPTGKQAYRRWCDKHKSDPIAAQKYTDMLSGIKSQDGTTLTRVGGHAAYRMKKRRINVGRVSKILREATSVYPSEHSGRMIYQLDMDRIVLDTDGSLVTVMDDQDGED